MNFLEAVVPAVLMTETGLALLQKVTIDLFAAMFI